MAEKRSSTSSKKSGEKKKTVGSKTPRKSRVASGAVAKSTAPEVQEAITAIKPLLGGNGTPSVAACRAARETIADLVYRDTPRDEVTLIERLRFLLSVKLSVRSLPGYATLDARHIKQIREVVNAITTYVDDSSQRRPLNLMMLASPGAGKSHFIKCIGAHLAARGIRAVTFNMAGMQANDDLIPALDMARNLKVEDKLPLLFLDEFDSSENNYALLLPLLWDGGLNLGQRDLRLGKSVIVMAGSSPTLPEAMKYARSMSAETTDAAPHNIKLIDLFSRVNGGVLSIPPFRDAAHKIDRRADKVCVAAALLEKRFGKQLERVPLGFLRFVAQVEFRYDVRSIAQLVDLIPYKPNAKQLTLEELNLPLESVAQLKESSLSYHLRHEDQAYGVIKDWKEATSSTASIHITSVTTRMLAWTRAGVLSYFMPQILKELK